MRKVIKAAVMPTIDDKSDMIRHSQSKINDCIELLDEFDTGGMIDRYPEKVYSQIDKIYHLVIELYSMR